MADQPATPPSTPARPGAASLASLKIDRAPSLKRRRRRWPWLLAAVVIGGSAAMLLAPRPDPVEVTSVVSATPSRQYVQLSASGYVVAQRSAAVSSKASGRLIELNVREGSTVHAGELLGRLETDDVDAALAASRVGVSRAQAGVTESSAAIAQARAERMNAQAEYDRSKGLVDAGFISNQALDAARTRLNVAEAALKAAQASQEAARVAVQQARAQVKVQQVSRDSTEIRAPFDGVVLVKNANVGDLITPFSNASGTSGAVVTIADLSTLEVEADVSESNVGKVSRDQPVEITLDALPDERFRGQVARIVPTVDRAKATVMTKVAFEKLDPRILPEMSAKVNFLSQKPTDADLQPVTAVNPAAVAKRDDKDVVFRIGEKDVIQAVPVQVGRSLGEVVEVQGEGLKSGDRVVLSPSGEMQSGLQVRIATGT